MGYFILLCWIIYYGYWIISAQFVKKNQKTQWQAGNIWWNSSIFLAFLALRKVGVFTSLTGRFEITSLVLVLIGLVIAVIARWKLGNNWSKDVVLKKDHELITTGMYRYIRHPIYLGFLLMGFGTVIYERSLGLVGLYTILFIFLVYKLRQEEKLLIKYFPQKYEAYKRKTKALIPFIF